MVPAQMIKWTCRMSYWIILLNYRCINYNFFSLIYNHDFSIIICKRRLGLHAIFIIITKISSELVSLPPLIILSLSLCELEIDFIFAYDYHNLFNGNIYCWQENYSSRASGSIVIFLRSIWLLFVEYWSLSL